MKTTASLSETMIAAAAAFRVSGRAKPRVLRRLLRFGADLAYVSAPDESIERPPAARWFYDNARMLEEACADALDALLLRALGDGFSVKDAAALAVERLGVKKKDAYARALDLREEEA